MPAHQDVMPPLTATYLPAAAILLSTRPVYLSARHERPGSGHRSTKVARSEGFCWRFII